MPWLKDGPVRVRALRFWLLVGRALAAWEAASTFGHALATTFKPMMMTITRHPIFTRFMRFSPVMRRAVLGAIFYVLFAIDMKYFPHTAACPWIAGITGIVWMWAWGVFHLYVLILRGLFKFLGFYLIFLRN